MKEVQPINQTKKKHFKVNSETGTAFVAIAELLNIDTDELLDELMSHYVMSVRERISDIADKHPSFTDKYPFIKHPNTS